MKINCSVNSITVNMACSLVEDYYNHAGFLSLLSGYPSFNRTDDNGEAVANKIKEEMRDLVVNVVPYKTAFPWSKVIGYAEGNTVYVNVRKLDLPLRDRTENIMHECLHLIGYTHKGNNPNLYNLNTVPYKVAEIFANYIESIYK